MNRKKIAFIINLLILITGFLPNIVCLDSLSAGSNIDYDTRLDNLTSWWWTPVELISESSTIVAYNPDIACDSDGNVHLVWEDLMTDLGGSGADKDVFYVQYNARMKTWLPLEVISTESTSSSALAKIDIDSENNIHVIWRDETDILGAGNDWDVFYKKRSYSGSWSTTETVTPDSTMDISFPAIHVDAKDTAHIVWSDMTTGDDILYKRRTSAGSWSSTYTVTEYSSVGAYSPSIASDTTGNIHFTWHDFADYAGSGIDSDIFFRTLNKDLTTWSPYTVISTESDDHSRFPDISVDALDRIHISWADKSDYDSAGIDTDVFYKYYDPQFDSWHISEIVSTESDMSSSLPRMVSDDSHLYLVWEDTTDYSGVGLDADIFFKYKDLTTDSWSSLGVLTSAHEDDSETPAIAIDNLGHLHVTWYDWTDMLGSGMDPDIFYRKFVGIPETPALNSIIPNPTQLGNISLSWTEASGAVDYQIYRDSSYFSTIFSLTPIATVSSVSYIDSVNATGTYFYTVIASNDYGLSSLSNIESIQVLEDELSLGFFQSLRLGEILVLAAILGGVQLLITTIVVVIVKAGTKTKSAPKKGKK